MRYDKYDKYGRNRYDNDISNDLFGCLILFFFVLIPILVIAYLLD